jgi:hypothetical protein
MAANSESFEMRSKVAAKFAAGGSQLQVMQTTTSGVLQKVLKNA